MLNCKDLKRKTLQLVTVRAQSIKVIYLYNILHMSKLSLLSDSF